MRSRADGDAEFSASRQQIHAQRHAQLPTLRAAIESFLVRPNAALLRDSMVSALSARGAAGIWPGVHQGPLQFLGDLIDRSTDSAELIELLRRVVPIPRRDGAAELEALARYVQVVKEGASPSLRNVVPFLSFCWWIQAPDEWPHTWPECDEAMRTLGWLRGDEEIGDSYATYVRTWRGLGGGERVDDALTWFSRARGMGLDPLIPQRLEWAAQLNETRRDEEYPDGLLDVARTNIAAVLAELRRFGDEGLSDVSNALGRRLRTQVAKEFWVPGVVRANAWLKWRPSTSESSGWHTTPSMWLFVTDAGVLFGFHPGRRSAGWTDAMRRELADLVPGSLEMLGISGMWAGGAEPDFQGTGEFVIGRWFPGDEMFDNPALKDEVERIAAACQPLFDRTMQLEPTPPPPAVLPDDPLSPFVEQYRTETGYPDERDERHRQARASMAAALESDALGDLEMNELGRICNSSSYGSTGFTNPLRSTLTSAGPQEVERIRRLINHLLWGEGSVEQRIDRCLDNDDLGVPGIGEAPLLKLLAIAHPERFLPLFRLQGGRGKLNLLASLGMNPPDTHASRGAKHVLANDALRARLEPFFPGDPWGQAQFAAWYAGQTSESADGLEERLDEVVQDCWLESRSFVDEVLDLLDDKGQIVLYGPPGTGKTFIAKKLAEAIAPDPELRRLVQFHPATTYEDFFEGYRPSADASGNLTYALQQGPFAELADHAAEDGRTHVLLIDELNRANIPKVFGELLFLLEYRGEQVVPLYRPDGFQLPDNLLVIATMNTADRSIASIDAALRRRFHFVGVFPDQPPIEGLLQRYLHGVGGEEHWAELVDMVNEELRDRLGNGDLLIGPSHFMKPDLDEGLMARIWRYDIEPFIEDQFFGDKATIDAFRWNKVLGRHNARRLPGDELPGEPPLVAEDDGGHGESTLP